MGEKIDFKRTLEHYRASGGTFRILDVPAQRYLMIDGHGDPNTSPEFAEALAALYPVAYSLKFASRQELGRDYVVPPLEGLWWAEDMDAFTTARDTSQWDWTMMLLVPGWIEAPLLAEAVARAGAKGRSSAKRRPARLDDVRLERLEEGRCVQTLHVGPFDEEGPVLAEMHHSFIPDNGLRMTGTHHEVYFSDLRRTAPEKLRTLLRQPVEEADPA
ncbi:GyrI-like domain-containing protein [Brevibacterium sp.]|uniref:GyrI-like domain-containing protein n=1 Tax=Brevibacterium sp. TaxID=1701 RepID=UPI0025BC5A46|nr:GyrI-like domain-containing protein [Brevibacterium sp.]